MGLFSQTRVLASDGFRPGWIPDGIEDFNPDGVTQSTETSPVLVDTDTDGLADGDEDVNLNGIWDSGDVLTTTQIRAVKAMVLKSKWARPAERA